MNNESKLKVSVISGIISGLGIVFVAVKLLMYITSLVPSGDWSGLIKVVIVVSGIIFGGGITVSLAIAIGGLIGVIINKILEQ